MTISCHLYIKISPNIHAILGNYCTHMTTSGGLNHHFIARYCDSGMTAHNEAEEAGLVSAQGIKSEIKKRFVWIR